VVKLVFSILSLGLPFLIQPNLQDQLYFAFYYSKELVKKPRKALSIDPMMNLRKLSEAFDADGWQKPSTMLNQLVPPKARRRITPTTRITKALTFFAMAQTQAHPLKSSSDPVPKTLPPILVESSTLERVPYAIATSIGFKSSMQDIAFVTSIPVPTQRLTIPSFILMDGHGKENDAPINQYIKTHFKPFFEQNFRLFTSSGLSLEALYRAFKATFLDLHKNYPDQSGKIESGTTFIGVFIIKEFLICVSIGDSRAVMFHPGGITPLNLTADPEHPYFNPKLLKRGGRIIEHRVEGRLATASAIGDKHLRPIKSPAAPQELIKPDMSFIAIPTSWILSPATLVLVSDGVSDVIPPEEMRSIVTSAKPPDSRTHELVKRAMTAGSKDNLGAIVIDF